MVLEKPILTKESLSGYVVLKRFKMIVNKINHCKGRKKIKIFISRKGKSKLIQNQIYELLP